MFYTVCPWSVQDRFGLLQVAALIDPLSLTSRSNGRTRNPLYKQNISKIERKKENFLCRYWRLCDSVCPNIYILFVIKYFTIQ